MKPDFTKPGAGLLIESLLTILVSSLAVRLLRFSRLVSVLERDASCQPVTAPPRFVAQLRRTIFALSRRLPWKTMCFEEGLTANLLLRRHGYAATLLYGAAMIDGQLKAHVWVRSGELDVIGCENASDFVILSRFSNDSPS